MERCGAKAKGTGKPCKKPAGSGTHHKGTGRCKLHGGASHGAPKGNQNGFKHGFARDNLIIFDRPGTKEINQQIDDFMHGKTEVEIIERTYREEIAYTYKKVNDYERTYREVLQMDKAPVGEKLASYKDAYERYSHPWHTRLAKLLRGLSDWLEKKQRMGIDSEDKEYKLEVALPAGVQSTTIGPDAPLLLDKPDDTQAD